MQPRLKNCAMEKEGVVHDTRLQSPRQGNSLRKYRIVCLDWPDFHCISHISLRTWLSPQIFAGDS